MHDPPQQGATLFDQFCLRANNDAYMQRRLLVNLGSKRFCSKVAFLVAAGASSLMLAQTPDATTDILRGYSYPPLRLILVPDATPNAPTGIFPAKMKVAYGFNQIPNQGAGQTIAIVDAFDDPNAEADLATFSTQF